MSEFTLRDNRTGDEVAKGDSLEEIAEQLELKVGDLDADWGEALDEF